MAVKFLDSKIVGSDNPPYIVAEVNSSHNGSVDVAKQMIDAAVDAGCDCVKFQSWTADTLYSKDYYKDNPIAKRFVTKFSLSEEELLECANYCREKGISFSSTPYSKREVDFLADKCKVPFIKISSMEVNNVPLLKYIAEKDLPIVLSTGMADFEEIKQAVKSIIDSGNKRLVVLHCVSVYPCDVKDANLNNIKLLQDTFPDIEIGYSDHTMGFEVACAAIAMGAGLIEKHLTLNRAKIGMDNQMATEPNEMMQFVELCKNVKLSLGAYNRNVSEQEREQKEKMRRSLVYTRDLPKGSTISADDLDAKRPGTGIPVSSLDNYIGKTLAQDVCADTMVSDGDFI